SSAANRVPQVRLLNLGLGFLLVLSSTVNGSTRSPFFLATPHCFFPAAYQIPHHSPGTFLSYPRNTPYLTEFGPINGHGVADWEVGHSHFSTFSRELSPRLPGISKQQPTNPRGNANTDVAGSTGRPHPNPATEVIRDNANRTPRISSHASQ